MGQIEFVTFHQNYSYEDFISGITPDISTSHLRFDRKEGVFKKLVSLARANWQKSQNRTTIHVDFNMVFNSFFSQLIAEESDEITIPMRSKGWSFKITSVDLDEGRIKFTKQSGGKGHDLLVKNVRAIYDNQLDYGNEGLGVYYYPLVEKLREYAQTLAANIGPEDLKNYVLIIDEINRANVSKVFGEIITLLEEDKRLGAENELKITLQNGEPDFGIPPNLYILGTMNTADKSIALVDIALRRRFEFVGHYPTRTLLGQLQESSHLTAHAATLLQHLNAGVYRERNSAEYLIGHAYFIKKQDAEVPGIIRLKIIPLLMEYFSGRVEKVAALFENSAYRVRYSTEEFDWIITPGQANVV
jgi:5-methylcytosine-specific restriction protein B